MNKVTELTESAGEIEASLLRYKHQLEAEEKLNRHYQVQLKYAREQESSRREQELQRLNDYLIVQLKYAKEQESDRKRQELKRAIENEVKSQQVHLGY